MSWQMLSAGRIGLLLVGLYVMLHTIGLDPVAPLGRALGDDDTASVFVAATRPRAAERSHVVVARKELQRESKHAVRPRAQHAVRAKERTTRAPRVERTIAQPAPRRTDAPAEPTVETARPEPKQPESQSESPAATAPLPAAPVAPPPAHLPDPPPLPLPDPTTLVDPGALQPVVATLAPIAPVAPVPALP